MSKYMFITFLSSEAEAATTELQLKYGAYQFICSLNSSSILNRLTDL